MSPRRDDPVSGLSFPIEYDRASDTVTINGFRFAPALFEHITASPIGVWHRIIERTPDGAITVQTKADLLEAAAPQMLAALKAIIDSPTINNVCGWYAEIEAARALVKRVEHRPSMRGVEPSQAEGAS